jgi:hypothetical protein
MQGFPSVLFGTTFTSVIVASSWSSIFTLPTLMMHGQTQIKCSSNLTSLKFVFAAKVAPLTVEAMQAHYLPLTYTNWGAWGGVVVKALRY